MVVEILSGRIIAEPDNIKQLTLTGYAGTYFNDMVFARNNTYGAPGSSDTTFKFINGRMEVWQDGTNEVTGNTTPISFIIPKTSLSSTTSSSLTMISAQDEQQMAIANAIQRLIDDLAQANGIKIPPCGDFEDRFLMYCYPLLREIWTPDINLFNIKSEMQYGNMHQNGLLHSAFKENTLKEAVKQTTGVTSSKMIKFIANNLIFNKRQQVNSTVMNSGVADRLISQGFNEVPLDAPTFETRSTFVKTEINFHIFDKVGFLSEVLGSVDYVYKFIEQRNEMLIDKYDRYPEVAIKFLKENFTPKKLLNLLLQNYDINDVKDAAQQCEAYNDPQKIPYRLRTKYKNGINIPKNFKNFKELHDKISAQYNEIKAEEKNKEIPYTEDEFKLHGYSKKEVEFVLPAEGKTVVEWGQKFKHCIASYIDRAAKKECVLIGVKVKGELKYTMEIILDSKVKWQEKRKKFQTLIQIDRFIGLKPEQYEDLDELCKILRLEKSALSEFRMWRIVQFYGKNNMKPERFGEQWIEPVVEEMLNDVFISNLSKPIESPHEAHQKMSAL